MSVHDFIGRWPNGRSIENIKAITKLLFSSLIADSILIGPNGLAQSNEVDGIEVAPRVSSGRQSCRGSNVLLNTPQVLVEPLQYFLHQIRLSQTHVVCCIEVDLTFVRLRRGK